MFDSATLTISGNVVANPVITGTANEPDRVTFRVVSNRRRRNPTSGDWEQVGEFGVNVVCWRKLARGAAHSLRRGDPVVVIGRMVERQYDNKEGEKRWRTEVVADFIGHDLAYGISGPFTRFTKLDRLLEAGDSAEAGDPFGSGARISEDLVAAVNEVEDDMDAFDGAADDEAASEVEQEPSGAPF